MEEYITFTITSKDGEEIEMAVVDEFDYKRKHYVAAAVIVGEEINSDELYIYRAIMKEDDFSVEKITNRTEYEEISKAYLAMESE